MNKTAAVLWYEYKMQLQRPALWGCLLAASLLAQADSFPSAGNLARLEFLREPAYFVYRIMSLDALLLLFGLSFLRAGRFALDARAGMRDVLMAAPVQKRQYVWGKLAGGFLCAYTVLCLFLILNTAVYAAFAPFSVSLPACLIALGRACLACGLPASLFTGFAAVSLAGVMDLRLCYLLAAVFFGWNASFAGSAEAAPCFLITAGDLSRLLWVHPEWRFTDTGSILANAAFLVGGGLLAAALPFWKRSFWRPE